MITEEDEKMFKQKQIELGLTDNQCNKIIEYLKIGFTFSDAETEFEGFILDYIDKKNKLKTKGLKPTHV